MIRSRSLDRDAPLHQNGIETMRKNKVQHRRDSRYHRTRTHAANSLILHTHTRSQRLNLHPVMALLVLSAVVLPTVKAFEGEGASHNEPDSTNHHSITTEQFSSGNATEPHAADKITPYSIMPVTKTA